MDFEDEDFYEEQERGPSRTQRKREAEALQKLGEELVALPPDRLKSIPLPDKLAEAVRFAQRIRERGARRRQLQLIGKLMRQEDPTPIREALARLEGRDAAAAAQLHLVERWRDRLLTEGDQALTEFMSTYPNADSQQLRQLVRAAQHEQRAGKPARSARELFRVARNIIEDDA